MFFIIDMVVVFGSVLGSYLPHGSMDVLIQPFEVLIIGGAAVGAFLIFTPGANLKRSLSRIGRIVKGIAHNKDSYIDLLKLLYKTFKLTKTKGNFALEAYIGEPEQRELFKEHSNFLGNHHAVEFMCDYLRLVTMGSDSASEIEDLMNLELKTHHAESHEAYGAISSMGEGMRIQLIDQQDQSKFEAGSALINPFARQLLNEVSKIIKNLPNRPAISGHTDAGTGSALGEYGNWELSADRANASRIVLEETGLEDYSMNSVTGRGATEPLIIEDPYLPSNRGVSIVFLREDNVLSPKYLREMDYTNGNGG